MLVNAPISFKSSRKALRVEIFFTQQLVEEGKISVHYVKTEDQLADMGTMHFSKHRHRNPMKLINEFKA